MNAGTCPSPDELVACANGLPDLGAPGIAGVAGSSAMVAGIDRRARILAHVAGCADCRLTLAALGMLGEPESEEESAQLDRLALPQRSGARILREVARRVEARAASPGEPAGRLPVGSLATLQASPPGSKFPRTRLRWARVSAVGVFALAAAASIFLVVRPADPKQALAKVQDGARPLEAAFSDLPYAPYRPQRGANTADESRFARPLRQLLEAEENQKPAAGRLLATLYAVRRGPGDVERAQRLLALAGSDADSENDRAVLLFAQGDLLAALESVDLALEGNPRHRPARFNRALLLGRLGFDSSAAEAFERIVHDDPGSPWAGEAKDRAARLRAPVPRSGVEPAEERHKAVIALLSADSTESVAKARANIARLPEGLAQDLVHLGEVAASYSPDQLAQHGKLFSRYLALRDQTLEARASIDAAQALVRDAADDPLVLVPALQLAAIRSYWAGALREQQELELRVLHVCKSIGCDAVSEAIAADELADSASRDGDYVAAHRLQARAEALFVSAAAEVQLGELQEKRALLFMDEKRLEEATQASALALRTLAPLTSESAMTARATAAGVAGDVAQARHFLRAELEMRQGGLALLAANPGADLSASFSSLLAFSESGLGRAAEAKPILRAELQRQTAAGHKVDAARVRWTLATLALRENDASTALNESTQALSDMREGSSFAGYESIQQLHILRARALLLVRGEAAVPEAQRELQTALDDGLKGSQNSADIEAQLQLARRGAGAGTELAALGVRAGLPAPSLLLPLDSLRSQIFRTNANERPLEAGWEKNLPKESCLVALLPAEDSLVRLAITPESSQAQALPTSKAQLDQLISNARSSRPVDALPDPRNPTAAEHALASALYDGLPVACSAASELWLWVEAPLDSIDASALPLPAGLADRAAVGFVNSLSRLLEPEPAWPLAEALLIDGAEERGEDGDTVITLPGAARERAALSTLRNGTLLELSGARLTPTALLARLPTTSLLHAAVHGSEGTASGGGSLHLSGELGRLRTNEVAAAHLPAGSRVVLSACHAAPGESGLATAFARAGALEIASAEGAIDDDAAARWAESFYPALARGLSFVRANREALSKEPAEGPRAWFVVTK